MYKIGVVIVSVLVMSVTVQAPPLPVRELTVTPELEQSVKTVHPGHEKRQGGHDAEGINMPWADVQCW